MKNGYSQKAGALHFFCFLFPISFIGFAQVGIGTLDPKSSLDVNGGLSLREGAALTLSAGDNQDIDLGSTIYSQYRIAGPTAHFNILSFFAPSGEPSAADGQLLTLINTTPHKMTIVHEAGSAPNPLLRIVCPGQANLVLEGQNSTATLQYNTSLQRWIVVGYADIGSYGRNIYSSPGTTDIDTNTAVFSDMDDMSINFTPKHSVVYVNFSASGTMDKGIQRDAQGYADFQIIKDATPIAGTTALATDRSKFEPAPICNGTAFYDSGGRNGNYSNYEYQTWRFNPTVPGEKVSVYFSVFDVESSWDGLMVYNGTSAIAANLISSRSTYNKTYCPNGAYTGTGQYSAAGLTFTSTHSSGSLFFVFTSDVSITYQGWEACVTSSVEPPPTGYSLDTAWNAGFSMYPVAVTPGVATTIKILWRRLGSSPSVLRNNVTDTNRFHRNLTVFD